MQKKSKHSVPLLKKEGLNVFPLTTPPLRERLHDIPYLVQFLMDKFAPKLGKKFTHISAASLQRLMAYAWPGNIRELENVIERAIILADGEVLDIEAEQLPRAALTATAAAELSLEQLTKEHIAKVLEDCQWVIEGAKGAAQKLQVQPSTLRYRMKKLGLSR
ncbi:MAG: hypothetical protein HOP34_07330 [Methylococcaceae bacterium]|nr:hypothetical protein [Methylococcaceae bacterium]